MGGLSEMIRDLMRDLGIPSPFKEILGIVVLALIVFSVRKSTRGAAEEAQKQAAGAGPSMSAESQGPGWLWFGGLVALTIVLVIVGRSCFH